MERGPLAGVRVADFSFAWAGPYAATLLGFMGAQVIKIESSRRPDHSRIMSITTLQRFTEPDRSPVFNDINLGKLGVKLNLRQAKAVELAKRIVAISDIVLHNMRPGVMDRLGLGYEALREVKPDIVYLSSSAWGTKGPERHYIGYAPSFAAFGGLCHLTGYPDMPPFQPMGEVDLLSATTSAFALLVALLYRQRTGEGQFIDLSSTESVCVLIGEVLMDYAMNHRVQQSMGNRDEIMAPHNCYRCKGEDKWISIAVGSDDEWRALCQAMGNPAWSAEERFGDAYRRWQNQEELDRLIQEWVINLSPYEAMGLLQGAGVAAVPFFNSEELYNDPHLKERSFYTEVTHPVIGRQVVVNPPWKLSATPARVRRHGPLLGEHNSYVFGELLGMSEEEIAELEREEVIY